MNTEDIKNLAVAAAKELFTNSNLEESCFTPADKTECEELFTAIILRHMQPLIAEIERIKKNHGCARPPRRPARSNLP